MPKHSTPSTESCVAEREPVDRAELLTPYTTPTDLEQLRRWGPRDILPLYLVSPKALGSRWLRSTFQRADSVTEALFVLVPEDGEQDGGVPFTVYRFMTLPPTCKTRGVM
jgi:hypothetical protein